MAAASRGGRSAAALAAFVAIPLLVGALGGLATASSVGSWYAGLRKPSFNPPGVVFGPVWTTLYILMGVAAWRVWRAAGSMPAARGPLLLWAAQLVLNLAWSFLFFGLRSPTWGLVEIVPLLIAICATTAAFWRIDRPAGLLLVPYAAWVAFATLLTFEIWRLN